MKIDVEIDDEEETMISEAFESAVAEIYFAVEIDEELKTDYYGKVQKLINKLGLSVNVDEVIDELIELNEDFEDNDGSIEDESD